MHQENSKDFCEKKNTWNRGSTNRPSAPKLTCCLGKGRHAILGSTQCTCESCKLGRSPARQVGSQPATAKAFLVTGRAASAKYPRTQNQISPMLTMPEGSTYLLKDAQADNSKGTGPKMPAKTDARLIPIPYIIRPKTKLMETPCFFWTSLLTVKSRACCRACSCSRSSASRDSWPGTAAWAAPEFRICSLSFWCCVAFEGCLGLLLWAGRNAAGSWESLRDAAEIFGMGSLCLICRRLPESNGV